MIDQIVDPRCQSVGLDLHSRELCAKSGQTLTEALAQMLKLRALEVRRRFRYCGSAQSQRDCGRSQVKQGKHHIQHHRKPAAVVSKLKLGFNVAIIEHNWRGSVAAKSHTVPRSGY